MCDAGNKIEGMAGAGQGKTRPRAKDKGTFLHRVERPGYPGGSGGVVAGVKGGGGMAWLLC